MNDSSPSSPAAPLDAARRRWLYGGVAAAAALGGGALAWWRFQPHGAADGAVQSLWRQTFTTPDGAPLAMQSFQGRPLLVNFWATWCPPCVEELPLLNRFYAERKAQGWQVVGLAIDQPLAVRQFLARLPLQFPIGMAGMGGTELGRAMGNLQGGLPFTVLLGANGRVLQRKMGQLTADNLARWGQQG
jgi:thiol-disulfide isomerase/thioredoxin